MRVGVEVKFTCYDVECDGGVTSVGRVAGVVSRIRLSHSC